MEIRPGISNEVFPFERAKETKFERAITFYQLPSLEAWVLRWHSAIP